LAFSGSTPYVVYQDNASGGYATVMMYNGASWVNVGSPNFSAGAAANPSLAIYNGVPYVAYGDAGNSNKATVMAYH
ncbi:MAG TPA: hypothetical protein VN963_09710, partial [bacterium]|nr:hypothetical protein [bacterium]